jgi:hypothetical protein
MQHPFGQPSPPLGRGQRVTTPGSRPAPAAPGSGRPKRHVQLVRQPPIPRCGFLQDPPRPRGRPGGSRGERWARLGRYFFLGGGGDFTGVAFASFFGFFFSLLCELLPLPMTLTSVRERELTGRTLPYAIASGRARQPARSFSYPRFAPRADALRPAHAALMRFWFLLREPRVALARVSQGGVSRENPRPDRSTAQAWAAPCRGPERAVPAMAAWGKIVRSTVSRGNGAE